MPTALITGISGQSGSYLAEFLLEKGYAVFGVVRRHSHAETQSTRIEHIRHRLNLVYGDMTDAIGLARIVRDIQPDEVYNLAAQSHVGVSFQQPVYTTASIVEGTLNLLEACRGTGAKFYQASSSEMFGNSPAPQNESTPFDPQSPYAVAKVAAHYFAQHYRKAYGMFVCCGILFNHESPRRGETFVTRKITRAATRIRAGLQSELRLGNLDAQRDWGFAGEYVEAMWRMLQHREPDDFVIATGKTTSVRAFLETVFKRCGLNHDEYVRHDERFMRPSEVNCLLGDASKARDVLGWEPKVGLEQLVEMMVEADAELASDEAILTNRRAVWTSQC